MLGDDGSSTSFLRRKLVRWEDGLMIIPSTSVENVVKNFEQFFGLAAAIIGLPFLEVRP